MKNTPAVVLFLAMAVGASVLVSGCSSAKKEAEHPVAPSVESANKPATPTSPVDLGASSSGRGL